MSESPSVQIKLRIPGVWSGPAELLARLPEGVRITPDLLILPGGEEFEFIPFPPDDQFAEIFCTSCRQPPSREERVKVQRYAVNVCLQGPGGSLEAALKLMEAGAAIVRAGGAGVFIDNCGLAHGGQLWLDMLADGGSDAVSYAFVGVVMGETDAYTKGIHTLGFADLLMGADNPEVTGETLVETLRYICSSEKPVGDGHVLMDENGPRYQCIAARCDEFADSPMHNPFGRLKLVPIEEIVEGN